MTTRCCVKEAGGQSPTKSWEAERKKLQREVRRTEVEKEHSVKDGVREGNQDGVQGRNEA